MNRRATLSVMFFVVCLSAKCTTQEQPAALCNDPYFGKQQYFEAMQVGKAWEITRGAPDCLIGVDERGFDLEHPDIRGNLLPVCRSQGKGVSHPHTYQGEVHGTITLGIIAAEPNNGMGIAGLAPGCKVVPGASGYLDMGDIRELGDRVRDQRGSPDYDKWVARVQEYNEGVMATAAQTIRCLVDRGCRVINCSHHVVGTTVWEAIRYASDHDVVVVIASGNEDSELRWPPRGYEDVRVLVVGACTQDGERWVHGAVQYRGSTIQQGSNYGSGLGVVAPCKVSVVCQPSDEALYEEAGEGSGEEQPMAPGYSSRGGGPGTSIAAPMATSLAALVRSLRPDLDHRAVISIVERGADDLGEEGYDVYTGHGRINFYKSLRLAQSWGEAPEAQVREQEEAGTTAPTERREVASPIVSVKPGVALEKLWVNPAGLIILRHSTHDRQAFGTPPRLEDPAKNPWGLKPEEIGLVIRRGQLLFGRPFVELGWGTVRGRLAYYHVYEFEPGGPETIPEFLTYRCLLTRARRPSEATPQEYIDAVLGDPSCWYFYEFTIATRNYVTEVIPEEILDCPDLDVHKLVLPALKKMIDRCEAQGGREKALQFIRTQGPRTLRLLGEELRRLEGQSAAGE